MQTFASGFGLIKIPVAPLREEPAHEAEMGTQAMLGTPVALDRIVDGEWWELTMPCGYHGYIHVSSIKTLTEDEAGRWRASRRMMSTAASAPLINEATGRAAGYAPFGSVLEFAGHTSGSGLLLLMPDGTRVVADEADFTSLEEMSERRPGSETVERVVERAFTMLGAPYLWGGTTVAGPDCSGLTQLCWREAGVILPRNASQQARVGIEIPSIEEAQRGDLLFYTSRTGRVDHVALYLGDGELIQSSGWVWHGTMSIDTDSGLKFYARPVASIRRIFAAENLPLLADNPLYFNLSEDTD